MEKNWITLQSIPVGGKTVKLEDQDVWKAFLDELALECAGLEPLKATVEILPQVEGVLFRGRVRGKVSLPCDRCADESTVEIDHVFDSFESFPGEVLPGAHAQADDSLFGDADEAVIRNAPHGRGIEVNPAALAWEEFSLALPVKPLCKNDCKGLCPVCGKNKNLESCACEGERLDPRMAALHGLTIKKK
mgnify:CR=1 FL=1